MHLENFCLVILKVEKKGKHTYFSKGLGFIKNVKEALKSHEPIMCTAEGM